MARLFAIQPSADFHAGVLDDGRQVLLGLLCPEVVVFVFGRDGRFITKQEQVWRHPAQRMGTDGPYQIYDPAFVRAMNQQIADLKATLGVKDGTIRVRQFFDVAVGIEEFPDYLEESEDGSPEDAQRRLALRREWRASGGFVLWWAKDYYMSKDGQIEST
ncbi:MAG: hypothetical protein R3B72_44340 [Polyangiaceae bacterium]